MGLSDIHNYIRPGMRAHLVGIGGVSMCALAEVLHQYGMVITGSDMRDSGAVAHLREVGIPVSIGHRPENAAGADLLIRTAAAHDDNPEIQAARAMGIPVFERASAWGSIMRSYKNAICIAGTHGKTTTTSMVTHIFMEAGLDPTVMIGGTLPLLGAGHRVGKGDSIILESCEYCNSFLRFFPTVAVILNVEEDHLDFFQDLQDIQHSFGAFANLVPKEGHVLVNADNPGAMGAVSSLSRPFTTFGCSEEAFVHCQNLTWDGGLPAFDIICGGSFYARAELNVLGAHNVSNALAAAAVAYALHVPGDAAARGLSGFHGTDRRFQRKGVFNGALIYDDYAHHPSELHVLLEAAKQLGCSRIICAFQPHTYTRTKALFEDFVRELQVPDIALLAEIYAAREQNTIGISSRDLAERIPGARYFATLPELAACLRDIARPGDLILTVGAGDIYKVGDALLSGENQETAS
ncbi:MAG: UDP-N-acetylmuramate--L-alanine ligase [Oscillospiraceae bacterium]|nr:UDP-N-acetylmuramate--L-alanine ligase [Oscillospiraceae bacterium]